LGLIQKKQEDIIWLLKRCRKDPGYADFLAASRLVYLVKVCGGEKKALRTWVRGPVSKQSDNDKIDSLKYADGVLALKKIMFGRK